MKTMLPTLRIINALASVAVAGTSHATDRVKANTADALNTINSWTGGVVPTSTDLAIFDSTLDATVSTYALGGNMTCGGIPFRDAQSPQIVTGTTTLTLANGSPGIAMTAAVINNLNLGCLVNLGTSGGQTFNVFDSARTLTISNVISGTGPLTKTGAGTLTLGLANDYSGATMISQGTLQLGVAHALPTNTVAVTLAGTLDLNGNNQTVIGLNGNGTVLNTSSTTAELRFGAGSSGTFAGVIADGGPGMLTVYKTGGGTQTLTGDNTFSGGSGNSGGTWQVGSDTALGSGPIAMAFTAALLSDSATPHTLTNSLTFGGASVMTLGNAANNWVLTFSGPVSFTGGTRNVAFNSDVIFTGNLESGALNKQGNGKLTMNGVATYTGNTVIQAGTLAGNGSFAGLVQIYAAATLSPGTGIGTMTLTSNLFLNVDSKTHMELNAGNSTCDRVQGLFKVTYQARWM